MRTDSFPLLKRANRSNTLAFVVLLLGCGAVLLGQTVAFEDSAPDQVRVSNASLSVSFSKANGQILEILDRAANRSLIGGSQAGCLWTASVTQLTDTRFTGGCSFNPAGANQFAYQWDAPNNTLRLSYASTSAENPSVVVAMVFSDRPYFDIRLLLQNRTDGIIQSIGVPGSLVLSDASLDAAYLPILLPGVRLNKEFFLSNQSAAQTYPSQLCFADFFAMDVSGTILSIYSIAPDGPINPVLLGIFDNETGLPNTSLAAHRFETFVRPGESYSSPPVRIHITSRVEEAILAYRASNGIAGFPSVRQKLGANFDSTARSPLVRTDFQLFGRDFTKWIADLDRVRVPAILHPVGFQTGGHDNNYPDFLPPNPALGTTADFRRFTEAAITRGFSVMPHTNYTWWNAASPTLRSLAPAELSSLMVQDGQGSPRYETYGDGVSTNSGFVVSASVPSVRSRVAGFWNQWKTEAGVNALFLDQIGARPWVRDYNRQASSPLNYYDSWLSLIESSPGLSFTTEGGWDRLAKSMWGFFGSAVSSADTRFNASETRWGVGSPANNFFTPGTWEPYPLATWLFHDKVLFYQHNLEFSNYTNNLEVLSWNALFGLMQTHQWPGTPGRPPDPQWVDAAQAVQRTVSARQAGEPLTEFSRISPDVFSTRFGDLQTVVNWSPAEPFPSQGGTIAPTGFMSYTGDGALLAGAFQTSFQNQPLTAGTHTLVLERTPALVTLRHPLGPATPFALDAPESWATGAPLTASAVDSDNNLIAAIPRTVDRRLVRFAGSPVNSRRPSRYLLQSGGGLVCTDAAAFQMGPVSPGQMVSIFGSEIGPVTPESARLDANGRIATEIAGTRLLVNGAPAPLLFVSRGQINAIIPYAAAGFDAVLVQLEKDGKPTLSVTVPVVNAMPRIFTVNGAGNAQAAALNEDGKLNASSNAARRGAIVTIYATGGGLEKVAAADGQLARDASRALRLPLEVLIDNRVSEVLYAGAAPAFAGMLQVNVRVPANSARGNSIPIEFRVAGAPSQTGVTIAVQ